MFNKKTFLMLVFLNCLFFGILAQDSLFCLSPNSSLQRWVDDYNDNLNNSIEKMEMVKDTVPNPNKPVIAVFDLHGVILEPTWDKELRKIYYEATGNNNEKDMSDWVNNNFLLHAKDKVTSLYKESQRLGKDTSEEFVRNIFIKYSKIYHDYIMPKVRPNALELIKKLKERNIPIVIVSGSNRGLVMEQLRKTQLIDYLDEINVVGLGNLSGILKVFGPRKKGVSKADFYDLLMLHYPSTTMVHFDDRVWGNDRIKDLGGINIGVVNGVDEEQKATNRENLIENGYADYVIKNWDDYESIADLMTVDPKVQQKVVTLPLNRSPIKQLDIVLPAKREGGFNLYVDVNTDFDTFTIYDIRDDSKVFLEDGKMDYDGIKMDPLVTIPLNLTEAGMQEYIRNNLLDSSRFSAEKVIEKLEEQKYYLNYRGVTVSFDDSTDKNISAKQGFTLIKNHISDLHMHTVLEDSIPTISYNSAIEKVILHGDRYGSVGSFFLNRMPNLKTINVASDNIYTLRLAARNMSHYRSTVKSLAIDSDNESKMPYMQERQEPSQIDYFYGTGHVGHDYVDDADLVVGNFCDADFVNTYDYAVNRVRDLCSSAVYSLKDRNSKGLILGINSLLNIDLAKEYGEFFDIEPVGEPREIEITALDRALLREKGYDIESGQKTYKIQVYHFKPNQSNFRSATQRIRSTIETSFLNKGSDGRMMNFFKNGMNVEKDTEKNYVREAFPYIYNGAKINKKMSDRVLKVMIDKKLRGIMNKDVSVFQGKYPHLSYQAFEDIHNKYKNVIQNRDLKFLMFMSLLYSRFSDFLSESERESFSEKWGVDFNQSNKATAKILRNINLLDYASPGLFENIECLQKNPHSEVVAEFSYRMLETRGLPGYILRGEAPYAAFSDFTDWIKENMDELVPVFSKKGNREEAIKNISNYIYLFNTIDMSSVRDGLIDDSRNDKMLEFFADFEEVLSFEDNQDDIDHTWFGQLMSRWNNFSKVSDRKSFLKDRFSRFYIENQFSADLSYLNNMIDELDDETLMDDSLFKGFVNFNGGYVEEATSVFRPGTQAKIIALIVSLSMEKGVKTNESFFIEFNTMLDSLKKEDGSIDFYRVAIIETFIASFSLDDILKGKLDISGQSEELGAFKIDFDGETTSLKIDFVFSDKAAHLLAIADDFSDDPSNPIFNLTLKELIKIYNLEFDDFEKEHKGIQQYAAWKDNILDNISAFETQATGERILSFKYDGSVNFMMGVGRTKSPLKFRSTDKIGVEEIVQSLEGVAKQEGYTFLLSDKDLFNLKLFVAPSTIVFEKLPTDETLVKKMFTSALSMLSEKGRLLVSYNLFSSRPALSSERYFEIMSEVASDLGISVNNLNKDADGDLAFFAFEKISEPLAPETSDASPLNHKDGVKSLLQSAA